jgi:DNA-binding transcriptional ArsR family regulator
MSHGLGRIQRKILHFLQDGPREVAGLAMATAAQPSSVRRALGKLADQGAVTKHDKNGWRLADRKKLPRIESAVQANAGKAVNRASKDSSGQDDLRRGAQNPAQQRQQQGRRHAPAAENDTRGFLKKNNTDAARRLIRVEGSDFREHVKKAGLTDEMIREAEKFVQHVLRPRGAIPITPEDDYSREDLGTLAILAGHRRYLQRVRSKKSRRFLEYRRWQVYMLLHYVVDQRYRDNPTSPASIKKIADELYDFGFDAGTSQVLRDIKVALQLADTLSKKVPRHV